jgi:hypothetical protein
MNDLPPAPWNDSANRRWFNELPAWEQMTKFVINTLQQDAKLYPHQIRAAAAMVIMFCREGVWPARMGIHELDTIVELAYRQLSIVKQQLFGKTREDRDLLGNPSFRQLLRSLDEELSILVSRKSDVPRGKPQVPPCTWGEFWA